MEIEEGPLQFLQKSTNERSHYSEANTTVYHAYIVGSHSRFIGAVRMDCADDDTAIKSAIRSVEKWRYRYAAGTRTLDSMIKSPVAM
jgi:hypothetical protein